MSTLSDEPYTQDPMERFRCHKCSGGGVLWANSTWTECRDCDGTGYRREKRLQDVLKELRKRDYCRCVACAIVAQLMLCVTLWMSDGLSTAETVGALVTFALIEILSLFRVYQIRKEEQ